jgi:hypothetical protein
MNYLPVYSFRKSIEIDSCEVIVNIFYNMDSGRPQLDNVYPLEYDKELFTAEEIIDYVINNQELIFN